MKKKHQNKIALIKAYMETLVGTRWTRGSLEKHLQEKFDLKSTLGDIDESGLVGDYAFLMGIYKEYGYMDIYYLKVPHGEENIYITEVSVGED